MPMPAFDKLIASVFTATNENTASLVSAKVDFTLFSIQAPPEFAQIGPALSAERRLEAEVGNTHRTARRLAALFEQLVPATPKLISAYGTRISQIIASPAVNPHGSKSQGPFASFAGADGTAMWAAATSGSSAISVYLLACLIARTWQHIHAIALWVELIEDRKKAIREGFARNEPVSEASLASTLQEISRDDLARWDSSARAWLRSADEAKAWELKQLELVTKDSGISFTPSKTPYEETMSSWTRSMQGMEEMLSGRPQEISDASILMAFSAWHLFPDLVVLSNFPTPVPFRDNMFQRSAVGTIGLTRDDAKGHGIRWSLALSHLQYYGPKVDVESKITQARVTFVQFRMVVLGCIFKHWGLNHHDYLEAAEFICGLSEILQKNFDDARAGVEHQLEWLRFLFQTSNDLLLASRSKTTSMILDDYLRLLAYGARRGGGFLTDETDRLSPFFGLCDGHVIEALAADTASGEAGISYFRSIAQRSGLSAGDGVIALAHYKASEVKPLNPIFYEFASIAPCPTITKMRDLSGDSIVNDLYARWFQEYRTENWSEAQVQKAIEAMGPRKLHVSNKGELTEEVQAEQSKSLTTWSSTWTFPQMPNIFAQPGFNSTQTLRQTPPPALGATWARCDFNDTRGIKFECTDGNWECGLFLRTPDRSIKAYSLRPRQALVELRTKAHSASLWRYMLSLVDESNPDARKYTSKIDVPMLASRCRLPKNTFAALQALSFANEIFAHINYPTISLGCLDTPMWQVKWMYNKPLMGDNSIYPDTPKSLIRCRTFGCIAFFDSGSINLDPDYFKGVIALCNENSIYVAAIVLSDPSKTPPGTEVRHIIGNIGRKGMSLLVAPQNPQVRNLANDPWLVNHSPYNHKRKDNFGSTSLHLSFTSWQPSISLPGQDRTIDHDIFYVEAILSVRERGEWVADLDILSIDFENLYKIEPVEESACSCNSEAQESFARDSVDIISIDTWNELLDAPKATGMFRARGNWAARLAATSIMYQKQQGQSVGIIQEGYMCLKCLCSEKNIGGAGLRAYEANLPSLCID